MKVSKFIVASSFAIFFPTVSTLSQCITGPGTGTGPGPGATYTITAYPPAPTVTTISQCNTGDAYCCNSSQLANVPVVSTLLGLLGIAISPVNALLGLGCTSIVLGDDCDDQAVCCTDNEFNGLVNIGCNNISL